MSTNDSKINEENDFSVEDDSYASVGDSMNTASGVGGTTTASETFDRVGSAASEFNDAGARPLDLVVDNAEMNDDSPVKWIAPLIILGLLIVLGYTFCGKY